MRRCLLIIVFVALAGSAGAADHPGDSRDNAIEGGEVSIEGLPIVYAGELTGTVTAVIDADTIKIDGKRMYLLGVDAPESAGSDCYAQESAAALSQKILGKRVTYTYEKLQGSRRDKHGRRRIYLFYDGTIINAWLVEKGFAFARRKGKYPYREDFLELEHGARKYMRGLWYACPVQCSPSGICRSRNW